MLHSLEGNTCNYKYDLTDDNVFQNLYLWLSKGMSFPFVHSICLERAGRTQQADWFQDFQDFLLGYVCRNWVLEKKNIFLNCEFC